MRLNITITTSNERAFKQFLRPLSVLPNSTAIWRILVMYTSKRVMKMLGCALYIRCALSIAKVNLRAVNGKGRR
jgi:hypothetical protein